MKASTQDFKRKSTETSHDLKIQGNLSGLYPGFHSARIAASESTEDWENMRDRAKLIKGTHFKQFGQIFGNVGVVTKGQVLPSLDELFILRQKDSKEEVMPAYTNLISGPSRSADIEYKLITRVHGPGEVHLLLVNES